jgi:hypothetical protein
MRRAFQSMDLEIFYGERAEKLSMGARRILFSTKGCVPSAAE